MDKSFDYKKMAEEYRQQVKVIEEKIEKCRGKTSGFISPQEREQHERRLFMLTAMRYDTMATLRVLESRAGKG